MTSSINDTSAIKPKLLSVPTPKSLHLDVCELIGVSLAGVRTSLYIPELKIGFDAGFPFPFQLGCETFFITHGHLDHAAAIPYIISQKNLNNLGPAQFYMPEELIKPLDEIMKIWQSIELHNYQYRFLPLIDDQKIIVNPQFYVRAFQAHHRIPALGYTIFYCKKSLKPEYEGLQKEQLVHLKKDGTIVDQVIEIPIMSFSGDSKIEFLWKHNWIHQAKFLLIESTYIDDRKTTDQAREWGHIHLDEILEALPRIAAEKIVLMHISSRYNDHQIKTILKAKIPDEYKERFVYFEGR